jgi:hypothetical protein
MVSGKTPVVSRDEYTIFFEFYEGVNFIHCDVYHWNKTVRKQLEEDFSTLKTLYGKAIYALHEEFREDKHIKFLKTFGFKPFKSVYDENGSKLDIYRTNEGKQ